MYYYLFILAVGLERLVELVFARRNAAWSIAQGGKEFGRDHYPAMLSMHTLLLVSCIVEVWVQHRPFIGWLGWPMVGVVVLSTVVRWWCVAVLGKHWNPRLIVIPGALLVRARAVPMVASPQLHRGGGGGGSAAAGSFSVVDGDGVQHGQCSGPHRADSRGERSAGLRLSDRKGLWVVGGGATRTATPAPANRRSARISRIAVTHENQVTPAGGAALMKLSLNAPQVGSRWAALNPTALANPTRIAAWGAHRLPRKTRTTVMAAATP
jgi:methyltransferase